MGTVICRIKSTERESDYMESQLGHPEIFVTLELDVPCLGTLSAIIDMPPSTILRGLNNCFINVN